MRILGLAVVLFSVSGCDSSDATPAGATTPPLSDAGVITSADGSVVVGNDGGGTHLEGGVAPSVFNCDGATFCDEFERTTDPKGTWLVLTENGDKASLVSDAAHGNGAIRWTVAEGASLHGRLAHGVPMTTSRVDLTFSYRPPATYGGAGRVYLAYLVFDTNPNLSVLVFGSDGRVGLAIDDKLVPSFKTVKDFADRTNQWNDVKLTVDIAAKSAALSLNGESVLPAAPFDYDAAPGTNATVNLIFGPSFTEIGKPFTIDYDSVRVDQR